MHGRLWVRESILVAIVVLTAGLGGACADPKNGRSDCAEVSRTIGADGGSVSTAGFSIEIPAGSLASDVEFTLRCEEPTSTRYFYASRVYSLSPASVRFEVPARVSMAFDGDASAVRLFRKKLDGSGFERVGGIAESDLLTADVARFAGGFVASGLDASPAVDPTCVRSRTLEGRALPPSALALFFVVEDCEGWSVADLDLSDFLVREDGAPLGSEASAVLLQKDGVEVFVTLALDVSSSTSSVRAAMIDSAKSFVEALEIEGARAQIGILLFAGEPAPVEWQPHTLSVPMVLDRLDEIDQFTPSDVNSTNLYGGMISAIESSAVSEAAFRGRNLGGAFTAPVLIVFSDGADTAGYATAEEVTLAAQGNGTEVYAVTYGASDIDFDALSELAGAGVFPAASQDQLSAEFLAVAERMHGMSARSYLLGYCSPKREGQHTVSVEVSGIENEQHADFGFDANGFGPGCHPWFFEEACDGCECGGIGCGACDDRFAGCSSASQTCVSYCRAAGVCNDEVILNPAGYEQQCAPEPSWYPCSAGCVDLLSNVNNCQSCGNACPGVGPGGVPSCVGGICGISCDLWLGNCDNDSVNGCETDFATSEQACGACGALCDEGETCVAGVCAEYLLDASADLVLEIAVDSTHLYYLMSRLVARVPLAGGTVEPIATWMSGGNAEPQLALDSTHVYWRQTDGAILRTLKAAPGIPEAIATYADAKGDLALDATHVYYGVTNQAGPSIYRAPKNGGGGALLASIATVPRPMIVDATHVYVGTQRVRKADGEVETISQEYLQYMVGDAVNIFGITSADDVVKVPKTGGTPTLLMSGQPSSNLGFGNAIALDGANLYWTMRSPPRVLTMPKTGGTPTILASPLSAGISLPLSVAVDDTYVYWSDIRAAAVVRVHK